MLDLHGRIPVSLRVRLAVVGAAVLLIGGTSGVLAIVFNQNGPFTGCLSTSLGVVYNVAQSATTPLHACLKADKVMTFSNSQGPQGIQGIQGVPGQNGTNGKDGINGTNGTNGTNGADGAKGDPGQPGPTGAPGAPGSTPIYVAERSNGTGVVTPDTLASNVNGFDVTFVCAPTFTLDTAQVSAKWLGGDPNVVTISDYSSGLTPGGDALSSSESGGQITIPLNFAIVDNILDGTTVGLFSNGFIIANEAGVVGSQQESGFQYSLYVQLRLNNNGTAGDCTVTGTLVPISGNRSIPLPFVLP